MAQHDFVPAWLNFSTPQPAKSPAALEQHGDHFPRGDARRRHNSSDGFFNNDPLRAPAGDGWQQPSLLRHDSVDSGWQGGLGSGPGWKETSRWHGGPARGTEGTPHHHHHHGGRPPPRRGVGERDRQGSHRHRNGNFHPRKGGPFQERFNDEERNDDKLKFVEEDFPSLNPETTGKAVSQARAVATPAGVWENPPSAKQVVCKMLVIKKVSREDPSAAFSAGFASASPLPTNPTKVFFTAPSIYKNLVPTKAGPWKPSGREAKPGLHFSGRDSAFISPVSVTKPLTPVNAPAHIAPKEPPSSTTPPIDITPPRLKLMRRSTDRKSEFLRGLKGEGDGGHSPGVLAEGESSTHSDSQENGLSHSLSDSDTEHLSSSLEAEHRLLKAMGWQEHSENDNFLPLTEDELREFQAKTEQLKRNGLGRNGMLLRPGRGLGAALHLPWRSAAEGSESETSSSQTSDDDDT